MGKEAAARFITLLAEDQDVREQVAGRQLDTLVAFAAQRGFDFTAAELQEMADGLVRLETGELGDDQLEGVPGGMVRTAALCSAGSIEMVRVAAAISGLGPSRRSGRGLRR